MKPGIASTLGLCASLCFLFSSASAQAKDSLTIKGKTTDGTFESMKNDKINFQPETGKSLHEPRAFTEKLVVDPPTKVNVTPKGKKKVTDLKLKGYEKSNFIFDRNGAEVLIPGMQITAIEPTLDFDRAANAAGTGKEEADDSKPLIIDFKSLSDWMNEGGASPEQTKAFDRYKAARETYNKFVGENATLVKAMDAAKGPAREEFINKLRQRKNDEQPLLGELKKAEQQLLTAFPSIKEPASTEK